MRKLLLALLCIIAFATSGLSATYYAASYGSGTTCSASAPCTLAYTCQTKATPSDWIMIQDNISATVDCSANDGTSGNEIVIVGRKHLIGTLTLGDFYILYGGNELQSLTLGASNKHFPYGQLLVDGTVALENYQSSVDTPIWWENYRVSDGSGGWEDYRVKE